MTDEQIIIDDQKKTIHRLQDECTEKTNAIIALGEQLKAKEQECEELKKANDSILITLNVIAKGNIKLRQTLAEIKEICKTNVCKHCYSKFKVDDNYCKSRKDCDCYNILQKINEVENE